MKKVLRTILCVAMIAVLCGCGLPFGGSSDYDGLAMGEKDFRNINIGDSVSLAKNLETATMTKEMTSEDSLKALLPEGTTILYYNATVAECDSKIIYQFDFDKFVYGSISIKTSDVEKLYSDISKYYEKSLNDSFVQKTEGNQQGGVIAKDGKYLMMLKGSNAVTIIVSDKDSFDAM